VAVQVALLSTSAVASPLVSTEQALDFFSEDILEHLFVQAEISDQLFQLPVFILLDLQSSNLSTAHAEIFLFPAAKRLFEDTHFPADLDDGSPFLSMPQGKGNPPRGVRRILQESTPFQLF
jgi:hypothetical protein